MELLKPKSAEVADWVLVFKPTIGSLTMKKIHIEKDTKSAHSKRKTVLSVSTVFSTLDNPFACNILVNNETEFSQITEVAEFGD